MEHKLSDFELEDLSSLTSPHHDLVWSSFHVQLTYAFNMLRDTYISFVCIHVYYSIHMFTCSTSIHVHVPISGVAEQVR